MAATVGSSMELPQALQDEILAKRAKLTGGVIAAGAGKEKKKKKDKSAKKKKVGPVGRSCYCSPRHNMPFDSRNEGSNCVSMTWPETGLTDFARHVTGCRLTQETRVQNALDDADAAGNSSLSLEEGQEGEEGQKGEKREEQEREGGACRACVLYRNPALPTNPNPCTCGCHGLVCSCASPELWVMGFHPRRPCSPFELNLLSAC